MKIRNISFVLGLSLMATPSFSQIEISDETQNEETKELDEISILLPNESTTEFFVIANWSSTNRKLIENPENDGIYADPLAERAYESSLNTWSVGFGIKDRILPFLTWEGGISYLRNGETYSFEDTDTLHTYTTTYSYISMPIKLYYTYGNNIKLLAGGGVIPQMFLKYKQDRVWVNEVNAETEESFSTQNGYASFVLSAVANIGVQVNLGKKMSVLFMPEYRFQLTTSNIKSSSYQHFSRALGFNMGLTYIL